ncbi:MAG: ABC transporter substrate-binding protein [bacterium]|nr:ABC transporter substrate-binding protein [bacterium]
MRLPSFSQWKKLPEVLSRREKLVALFAIAVFLISSGNLIQGSYLRLTKEVAAYGGLLQEHIVGSPRFLNPVYSDVNDADRDLVQFLFSGLLEYNEEGVLVPDLAQDYEIQEGGKVFAFNLKENVKWHDGYPFSADDVVFTIKTIQDPKYKSPIRANWVGVEVEKVNAQTVRFSLSQPYAAFPDRLTLKIIPAHIWENINPENFALSFYNLQPIGTGPYKLEKISQDKSGRVNTIRLERYRAYHGKDPFIGSILFAFSDKEESSITTQFSKRTITYQFPLARYFALFFNLDASKEQAVVKEKNIREALNYAIDKNLLNEQVLKGDGTVVDSPVRADLFGFKTPEQPQRKDIEKALSLFAREGYAQKDGKLVQQQNPIGEFRVDLVKGSQGAEVRKLQECLARDPGVYPEESITGIFGALTEKAVIKFQEKYRAEILTSSGLTKGTGAVKAGTRAKLNELCGVKLKEDLPLTITITTLDQSPLTDVAKFLQAQWNELGIETIIQTYPQVELERDVIKPRNYQTLLFGEIVGKIPDPFPFWHSSQKKDPGLNLSSYESKEADKLLGSIRKELDEQARATMYESLQALLLKDVPALFLYDMPYTYEAAQEVKGIKEHIVGDPSQRFAGMKSWYIETKRVLK